MLRVQYFVSNWRIARGHKGDEKGHAKKLVLFYYKQTKSP